MLLLGALQWPLSALAVDPDELLPPDQAFAYSVEAQSANELRLNWKIAEGYYLYRDKLRVSTDTPGVVLGLPQLPPGEIKHDEFFGDVSIYRGAVSIAVPVRERPQGVGQIEVQARSQGCADIGVCYPPHEQVAAVTLPAEAPPTRALGPTGSPAEALRSLSETGARVAPSGAASDEEEFLPPDEAFVFAAYPAGDARSLVARWEIAPGYYLYRDKIKLALSGPKGVHLGAFSLPSGKVKDDEFFGRIEVYYGDLELVLPISGGLPDGESLALRASYQGCAERGLCYPPIEKLVKIALAPAAAAAPPSAPAVEVQAAAELTEPGIRVRSEQDRIADALRQQSTWITAATFFGFGLLLAFTPCVFPMIPILSSIIVGQGRNLGARGAFGLSLVYVLAMAVTYTAAGVLAGLFGQNLQAAFQEPWILVGFSAIFVLLSLSMFGFYELQIPSSLQSRLTALSNRQHGGTLLGVGIMGFLSALIVGPCVAAPLAGALIYIGQTGDAVLGGLALFALSIGMGAPLLAIGTSAGQLLPRAGAWMSTIKAVFGVLLLGVAVWMLERILPGEVALLLWALLLIIPAVYMGALEPLAEGASGWRRLWKGVGLAMLIYGALLVIGAASGGNDALQPLRMIAFAGLGNSARPQGHLPFQRIKSSGDLDRRLAEASATGRPTMLDVYADWCTSCKEMDRYTFSHPEVQAALSQALLLQADVTANDASDQALLKRFGLFGPPSILFFGPDGEERTAYRLVGFLPADEFREHATQAIR